MRHKNALNPVCYQIVCQIDIRQIEGKGGQEIINCTVPLQTFKWVEVKNVQNSPQFQKINAKIRVVPTDQIYFCSVVVPLKTDY